MIDTLIFLNTTVHLQYQTGDIFYECVGKVIKSDEDSITLGLNFYLDEAIDFITVGKEAVIKIDSIVL
jgi:hypothetical protein